MSTSMTYNNLDNTEDGYYYRWYNATDGANYEVTFKIVIKVGNPQPVVNVPEKHIRYYYQDEWMDQLAKYGEVTYNGTTEVEPTSFLQEYTYDDQGNPTHITNFYYDGDVYIYATLEYSGRQLTSIVVYDYGDDEVVTISYTYNDQGYRTSKTIDNGNSQIINYTLSGDKVLYETDGTYGIIYTYDADGKIIGFSYDDNISSGDDYVDYFYIRNQQGDITKIFRMDGTTKIVLVEYEYDAWGNIISRDLNLYQEYEMESIEIDNINQYFYRGYRYDSEIDLYYLNSRFYDSNVGRFINADGIIPHQGSIIAHNTYSYGTNNFVMSVDYSGYSPEGFEVAGGIALGIATVVLIAALIACPVLIPIAGLSVASGGAQVTSNIINRQPAFQNVLGATIGGAITGLGSIPIFSSFAFVVGGNVNAAINEWENSNRENRNYDLVNVAYEGALYSILNLTPIPQKGDTIIRSLNLLAIDFAGDALGFTVSDMGVKEVATSYIRNAVDWMGNNRKFYILVDGM